MTTSLQLQLKFLKSGYHNACRRLKSNIGVCTNSAGSTGTHAARVAAARSYLDAWVGSKPVVNNTTSNDPTQTRVLATTRSTSPLLLSGSSYLLATLRLETKDTPESLAHRLHQEQQKHHHHVLHDPSNTAKGQWRCPIVLDLRAWSPDGSPHYRPPKQGTLKSLVHLLDRHGLAVVGVTGTPPNLEREAVYDLGLPSLWSKQQCTRDPVPKLSFDEVLSLVVKKQLQEPILAQDKDTHQESSSPTPPQNLHDVNRFATNQTSSKFSVDSTGNNKIETVVSKESAKIPEANMEVGERGNDIKTNLQSLPSISPNATIYQGSVRSGQQVASEKGRSLIVLGSVSSGGEVLSDGDIVVLGKLRGRALAGLAFSNTDYTTQNTARIVATSMDPELVCIGQVFSTIDNLEDFGVKSGAPAMASITKQGQLSFENINTG